MRYSVKGFEIRTENTAKSGSQPAAAVLRWICELYPVKAALDYGCGKLRYAHQLARKCSSLTLVDSKVQLDRIQLINGQRTSVRAYAQEHLPGVSVLSVEEFGEADGAYDVILCANVLSAIPTAKARSSVLRKLCRSLGHSGRCLFVTQYQNSYFSNAARSPHAVPHLDGWILHTRRGAYYYGVLPREKLERIARRHGFAVLQSWVRGQSAFVIAGHRPRI